MNQQRFYRIGLTFVLIIFALSTFTVAAAFNIATAQQKRRTAPVSTIKKKQTAPVAESSTATSTTDDDKSNHTINNVAETSTNEANKAARLAQLETILAQPPVERVQNLKTFLAQILDKTSPLYARATEQLVSAHAALGDELLTNGDTNGGIKNFREAVAAAPSAMSEKLFIQIIAQLPSNLFLRGERVAAIDLARRIEKKIATDSQKLLALATFYLSTEQADEAARIIELSLRYAENPTARIALGTARRINLQLEEAASEYRRALELDKDSAVARRNLADLYRATGKPSEAVTLYQTQLAIAPDDAVARTGLTLTLFDVDKRDEAERELKIALDKQPDNLSLLTGAAYWYAAHNEPARSLELAERAVRLEPRYTWANIALARALMLNRRPLEAERALRLAMQYGIFPTLSYELASALYAAGLYEEAAAELARTFQIKPDGTLSTKLAGRINASAADFRELLAPERRAAIFQFNPADTEADARVLRVLLALHNALETTKAKTKAARLIQQKDLLRSAEDFISGDDVMRVFRQLFVVERLIKNAADTTPAMRERVLAIVNDAAAANINTALAMPHATVATLADELRQIRLDAIAVGSTPSIPDVPPVTLSAIIRGRFEDVAGRTLAAEGKYEEAITRLRRAATLLPEGTPWARANDWHLGVALEASGNNEEALAAYIKSYKAGANDPVRRAVIEVLYRRINNSLDGLEQRLRGM